MITRGPSDRYKRKKNQKRSIEGQNNRYQRAKQNSQKVRKKIYTRGHKKVPKVRNKCTKGQNKPYKRENSEHYKHEAKKYKNHRSKGTNGQEKKKKSKGQCMNEDVVKKCPSGRATNTYTLLLWLWLSPTLLQVLGEIEKFVYIVYMTHICLRLRIVQQI